MAENVSIRRWARGRRPGRNALRDGCADEDICLVAEDYGRYPRSTPQLAYEIAFGPVEYPSLFDPLPDGELREVPLDGLLSEHGFDPDFMTLSWGILCRQELEEKRERLHKHWSLAERIEKALERAPGKFNTRDWKRTVDAYKSCCAYCGRSGTYRTLCIEHVVPVAQGGETVTENIVPACWSCNSTKGGARPDQWLDAAGLEAFYARWAAAYARLGGES